MFGFLCDLILLPPREHTGRFRTNSTAQYFQEVPFDLIQPMLGEMMGRSELLVLNLEYGVDFHGHDRVLLRNRVFHRFDPQHAHRSQFLHPVLRYFNYGVSVKWDDQAVSETEWGRYKGETAVHHVLEDIHTVFSNHVLHTRPLQAFLERIRSGPLQVPDPIPYTGWPDLDADHRARATESSNDHMPHRDDLGPATELAAHDKRQLHGEDLRRDLL